MSELKKVVKFSISAFGISNVLISLTDFFNRKNLLSLFMLNFVDLAVSPLSDETHDLIGFVDMVVDIRLIF